MPAISAHQCHLPEPISATTMPHISSTYQCPSELLFSATYQCCQSVSPISAASQCHLSVLPVMPVSAAYQCHI
ncbi:unnamed protein product [Staurois parvus]|uniref:Uncharacterized protein n=1 Tax=Staurois parvus TaxID=386267 RepID=A0ABN9FAQ4_9NEOB|nr:unnamed protein product [Staurois parvus]